MKYLFLIIVTVLIIFRPTPIVEVGEVESLKPSRSKQTGSALPSPTVGVEKKYTPQSEVEQKICELWGDDCSLAVAVFKAESGLRADAQGWNCRYDGVSRACKPEDRAQAWSVDCGVAQLNVAGQVCPPEYFDADWNIEHAYSWKYLTRGKTFTAWVAYTGGHYLSFLK